MEISKCEVVKIKLLGTKAILGPVLIGVLWVIGLIWMIDKTQAQKTEVYQTIDATVINTQCRAVTKGMSTLEVFTAKGWPAHVIETNVNGEHYTELRWKDGDIVLLKEDKVINKR